MYRLYDKRKCRKVDGGIMKIGDTVCKTIAIVILGTVLILSYGCDQIDTYAAFLDAQEKAGESPIIRYPDTTNCFLYVDNNSNIHKTCYNVMDTMKFRDDKILFNYNEYMKYKEVEK